MQNAITFESLKQACDAANTRYMTSNNVETGSADIAHAVKDWLNENSAKTLAEGCEKSGIDAEQFLNDVAQKMGVKAVKRVLEFAYAITSEDYRKLDATTVLTVISAAVAGAKTPDAVRFAVTGIGDESTSDVVRDTAAVRKLQTVISKVGAGTVNTQVSRSFGDNGFCKFLGIAHFEKTEGGKRYKELKVKRNWFYKRMVAMIEKGSAITLREMRGADKSE